MVKELDQYMDTTVEETKCHYQDVVKYRMQLLHHVLIAVMLV